ncbi:hypothetical protein M5D96_002638 [Drosophila gunungcola]|uniref:Uncharacterized protein n=1 Tax=Drosophila gunungcola TaxID=103775 RepID=A0A9Q0BWH9_9MUSC|nr:hypothetical protein M5D96_002638 [Drosophila gunungcola]
MLNFHCILNYLTKLSQPRKRRRRQQTTTLAGRINWAAMHLKPKVVYLCTPMDRNRDWGPETHGSVCTWATCIIMRGTRPSDF